ncbi:hypothetical protein V8E54_006368 [Elaphomyces granulatus]
MTSRQITFSMPIFANAMTHRLQPATRIESCSPGLPRQITVPIPVKGIAAAFESTEYVAFDVFFPGANPQKIEKPHMTAKIRIEAHIVPELQSKLLIGTDIMEPEGMNMDLLTKKVTIASCGGLEIPISLRAIYAAAVDVNFAFVHAINRTEEPLVIPKKTRVGIRHHRRPPSHLRGIGISINRDIPSGGKTVAHWRHG